MALGKTCEAFSVLLDEMLTSVDLLNGRARDSAVEDSALPGIIGDAADNMHGWLADASAAARDAVKATCGQPDLEAARRALVAAKEAYFRLVQAAIPLFELERLEEIEAIGRELRGDWADWALQVTDALAQCRELYDAVLPALFDCFEELVERALGGAVSVQTTSVGQQLSIPRELLASEAVT
jgi:hypothetical protein